MRRKEDRREERRETERKKWKGGRRKGKREKGEERGERKREKQEGKKSGREKERKERGERKRTYSELFTTGGLYKFLLTYFEQDFFNHLLAVIVHSHKATERFSQKYHPVDGGTAIKVWFMAVPTAKMSVLNIPPPHT